MNTNMQSRWYEPVVDFMHVCMCVGVTVYVCMWRGSGQADWTVFNSL